MNLFLEKNMFLCQLYKDLEQYFSWSVTRKITEIYFLPGHNELKRGIKSILAGQCTVCFKG